LGLERKFLAIIVLEKDVYYSKFVKGAEASPFLLPHPQFPLTVGFSFVPIFSYPLVSNSGI
jgi:hypothetical protein